ncbi:NGG1p interacting factor NIF3 [Candidatus Legionella polyplacis]|uniref:NGG1p interacting factor NIF3 n=1 Tax=Candidatus Legionella polyplacis TaxID=2005262 RepID=A0ABZ2H044_9GAMM
MENLIYKIITYIPKNSVEKVKQALFSSGAGKLGNYTEVCWQCLGIGQFKPLKNANPTIGKINSLTYVKEYKVEMICKAKYIHNAIKTLKLVHPYEEPAYEIIKLEKFIK